MGLINLRDLVAFPGGSNATDTLINGVHFNTTNLNYWNFTLYSNNTLSNGSNCYVIFDQFRPSLLTNGTWVNATSCYIPYYGIGQRGKAGIAFASFFALSIMFTLVNLKKHGQQFLREDKRFRIVGRRWQWYWMLFVAGCGIISCVASVDVDRDYLQEIAIVLQPFFFYLVCPGIIACVWEATRHWGSWQERQIHDISTLRHDDRRSRAEFYLPLIFYLFDFLFFFMTIPRSWGDIELQRSPDQQQRYARSQATDGRFKAGAVFATVAYFVIIYDLRHNLHYYRPSSSGLLGSVDKFCREAPARLVLALACLGVLVAYLLAASWIWEISLMKYNVSAVWPYALGYTPVAAIIIIFNIFGFLDENEDKLLIRQRQQRDHAADAGMGLVKKPAWWSKARGDSHLTMEQRMFREVGGGKATATRISQNLELQSMNRASSTQDPNRPSYIQDATAKYEDSPNSGLRDRSRSRNTADPFSNPSPASIEGVNDTGLTPILERGRHLGVRPSVGRDESNVSNASSTMTGTTLNAPPQRIRSMLDV